VLRGVPLARRLAGGQLTGGTAATIPNGCMPCMFGSMVPYRARGTGGAVPDVARVLRWCGWSAARLLRPGCYRRP